MVRRKRHMQGGSIKEFRRDVEICAALEVQRSKPPAPVVEEALTIPGFFYDSEKERYFPLKQQAAVKSPPIERPTHSVPDAPSTLHWLHDRERGLRLNAESLDSIILSRLGIIDQSSVPVQWGGFNWGRMNIDMAYDSRVGYLFCSRGSSLVLSPTNFEVLESTDPVENSVYGMFETNFLAMRVSPDRSMILRAVLKHNHDHGDRNYCSVRWELPYEPLSGLEFPRTESYTRLAESQRLSSHSFAMEFLRDRPSNVLVTSPNCLRELHPEHGGRAVML